MKTPDSDKLRMLVGQSLRTPRAEKPAGKPAWYNIPQSTNGLVLSVYTGMGNSVGATRGQFSTLDGWAVIDFARVLEEMASSRGDKKIL